MQFTLVSTSDGESNLTVFVPGDDPRVAHSTHPRFEAILDGVLDGDESVLDLFDVAETVSLRFERLSDRLTAQHGRIYLDGDEIDNSLTQAILRFLDEGVEDWQPLVAFFEKVLSNPNEHSREQLYNWLAAHDLTLTADGDIVGYKGVSENDEGELVSGYAGKAIVDGEVVEGNIPNAVGSVIEMPRSEVAHDPHAPCSTGLHVGTFSYAESYANGAMLEVHVNPRDVVSVPHDAAGEKVRVCRYRVADVIDAPHSDVVVPAYETLEPTPDTAAAEDWLMDCIDGDSVFDEGPDPDVNDSRPFSW